MAGPIGGAARTAPVQDGGSRDAPAQDGDDPAAANVPVQDEEGDDPAAAKVPAEEDEVAQALLELSLGSRGVEDGLAARLLEKGVQVNTHSPEQKTSKLVDLLDTDSNVLAFTGLQSVSTLQTIVSEVAAVDQTNATLPVYDRVVLVLVRLKTCLPFTCLAALFGVSRKTATRHFYATLQKMAAVLEAAIPWPDKNEISRNVPQCFTDYREVREVLDCTEVQLEKSHCASCRILTYSHYKGVHTAKVLVGVSPAGLITFISNGFGGRASDKACVEKSAVLHKLDSFEDDVMVDKGFNVDDSVGSWDLVLCSHLSCGRKPSLQLRKLLKH
ncbi:hypothetical protein HPB48_010672 [Haemaphysalis longicornis]|uniref:Tick transposon n=1 Tax=Haemaphysalis longicornis TaxID=44386 RepID=A0A9J6G2T2_HAELO|nr:hypothetical protein HPB48_010672 [Haemaphysalis longicornis]